MGLNKEDVAEQEKELNEKMNKMQKAFKQSKNPAVAVKEMREDNEHYEGVAFETDEVLDYLATLQNHGGIHGPNSEGRDNIEYIIGEKLPDRDDLDVTEVMKDYVKNRLRESEEINVIEKDGEEYFTDLSEEEY